MAEETTAVTDAAVTEVDPTKEVPAEMTVAQETLRKADASNAVRRVTWREIALNSEVAEEMPVETVAVLDVDPPDPQDLHLTEVVVIEEETVAAESIAPALPDQEAETQEEVPAPTKEATAPAQEAVLAQEELTEARG